MVSHCRLPLFAQSTAVSCVAEGAAEGRWLQLAGPLATTKDSCPGSKEAISYSNAWTEDWGEVGARYQKLSECARVLRDGALQCCEVVGHKKNAWNAGTGSNGAR